MGRWDLHGAIFPLLVKYGIQVDASVRPLHFFENRNDGPDHFDAPAEPYWISVRGKQLLEVPLTVTPLLPPLAYIPHGYAWGRKLRATLRHWGALPILPVEHPLWMMKMATNVHVNSGGSTLSIAWHSSDLMPGGNPRLADEAAVNRFVGKIGKFLDWLENNFAVSYVAVTDLKDVAVIQSRAGSGSGDWIWTPEPENAQR